MGSDVHICADGPDGCSASNRTCFDTGHVGYSTSGETCSVRLVKRDAPDPSMRKLYPYGGREMVDGGRYPLVLDICIWAQMSNFFFGQGESGSAWVSGDDDLDLLAFLKSLPPMTRREVRAILRGLGALEAKSSNNVHTLYRFFAADDALLYVGVTNSPPTRFRSHRADKDWWDLVETIKMEQFSSRPELLAAEALAIKTEGPIHNVIHNRATSQ